MTTPITAPMVPLGPDLAPGKSEPTTLDGFAALLGELVTLVAAGKPVAGQQADPTQTPAGEPSPLDPTAVAASGAVATCVVPLTPPGPTALTGEAPVAADVDVPPAPAGAAGTRSRPELPDAASPVARAAVLRHGPATPRPDVAPAVFAAVAERAALPAVVPVKEKETPAVAVPEQRLDATPVVAAAPTAEPRPEAMTAGRPVERTEGVRPAILEAARGLRHEGNGRTSLVVRLNPPELGSVLVKLTVQDGRVEVQLRTPDLQAVGDLTAQSREVQQVLKDSGFDLTSFDVTHGGIHDGQGEGKTPDRGTTQRDRRTDGRPEAVHVTDDVPEARPAGTWL